VIEHFMDVYWLEQTDGDVPAANDWLSEREQTFLSHLRFAKRRSDWRLGRWTAKQAVARSLNMSVQREALAGIEIRSAASGAPEVFFANQPAPVTISLSHRDGAAICAVALSSAALGCDLEMIEPRSDAFVTDYFTPEEQTLWRERPQRTGPVFWLCCGARRRARSRPCARDFGSIPGVWS